MASLYNGMQTLEVSQLERPCKIRILKRHPYLKSSYILTQAMNIYRFADGKIVEERDLPDLLSLLMQIDAMSN